MTPFHGLPLAVPPEWQDASMYCFISPDGSVDAKATMVVARLPGTQTAGLGKVLAAVCSELMARQPNLKTLGSGALFLGDTQALWQDLAFGLGSAQATHQRQIVCQLSPEQHVLVTLTAGPERLAALTTQLGFRQA